MEQIRLERIEHPQEVTPETAPEFLRIFQQAVLLALLESGALTELQYHNAENALQKQCFDEERG